MPWPLPEGAVLGVFAAIPEAGQARPMLASSVGPELAAEVDEAMLLDLVDLWGSDRVLAPGGRRVVVFDPPEAGPWFDARVPESFSLQPQEGADPGARLRSFFAGEFADGASAVVAVGADAPAVDPSVVVSAFLCLEQGRDVVLGPSSDGGYYLVGVRRGEEVPPIFDGLDWGTPDVLSRTIDRLNQTGLTLAVLTPCYKVHTVGDLKTLAGHLRALRRSGLDPGLPRTEDVIERVVPRPRG